MVHGPPAVERADAREPTAFLSGAAAASTERRYDRSVRRGPKLTCPAHPGSLLERAFALSRRIALACGLGACASARTSGPAEPLPVPPTAANGMGVPRSEPGASATTARSARQPAESRPAALGTRGPVLVEVASPNGRWASLCQAREDTDRSGRVEVRYGPRGELLGDALESYFVLGAGPGEPIDGVAAYDPTGRHVVLVVNQELILVDTLTQKRHSLTESGGDGRWDALAFVPHRGVAFDSSGSRLAYVRADPRATRSRRHDKVVIRELPSGAERLADPGGGAVWRLRFLPDGRQIALDVVVEDTNKNGRLDWPVPELRINRWRCHGPITTFPAWPETGDRTVTKLVGPGDSEARVVDGWVAPLGEGHLVRGAADQLLYVTGSTRSVVTDAACAGRSLHVDPIRRAALIACTGQGPRASVFWVSPGRRLDLGIQVPCTHLDYVPEFLPRLVPVYPGGSTVVVDLDKAAVVEFEAGDEVVLTRGATAVVRRGESLIARDVDSGRELELARSLVPFGDVLVAGSTVYVPPFVVTLDPEGRAMKPKVLGKAPPEVLGLSEQGQVLVAARPGSDSAPPTGPLRWASPEPLDHGASRSRASTGS